MRAAGGGILILVALFICNCAPVRFVKPLEKDQHAVAGSFGGPMIKFGGAPIPMPFTTLSYGFGATSRTTVHGSLHTTSLLFGNLQLDAGATIALLKGENRNGISLCPSLQFAGNRSNGRLWPSLDINYYRHLGSKGSFIYAGAGSWFELSPHKAHGEQRQNILVPGLHFGFTRSRERWQQQLELKYLAPGTSTLPGVVDYIGVNGKGVFAIYLSVCRKF